MHDGQSGRLRLVLRFGGRERLPHLPVDQLPPRRVRAVRIGGAWVADHWMVSGLTEQDYPGLIPLPVAARNDQFRLWRHAERSVDRALHPRPQERAASSVIFYPFLLGTGPGFPWRGRITFAQRRSHRARRQAMSTPSSARRRSDDFTPRRGQSDGRLFRRPVRLDLSPHDPALRKSLRVAGGVNLFVIGSELRGLEIIRGPAWTKAGTTDGRATRSGTIRSSPG